ncbi:MAG TPA: mechanosensitive ion channel domain-containing protein [Actinomycetota bacterium]|nr:mechanosensitive ion channel domain-containing protein [Actinomycetota bacterium]
MEILAVDRRDLPTDTVNELARQTAEWAPRVLVALAILLVGWLLARLLRLVTAKMFGSWTKRLTPRIARIMGNSEIRAGLQSTSANRSVARGAEMLVFWIVFLVFVTIATESLGLDIVSGWLTGVVRFVPRILGALFVVFLGTLIASAVRTAVTAAAASAGFSYAQAVGRMARIGVLLISVIVALDQVGLDVAFLIVLVAVVAGAMLGGAALAFGLGARTSVSNILASHYLVDTFKVGHRIRIGDVEGKILEITPTSVIVEADQGRTVIPASQFSEQVATLLSQ